MKFDELTKLVAKEGARGILIQHCKILEGEEAYKLACRDKSMDTEGFREKINKQTIQCTELWNTFSEMKTLNCLGWLEQSLRKGLVLIGYEIHYLIGLYQFNHYKYIFTSL